MHKTSLVLGLALLGSAAPAHAGLLEGYLVLDGGVGFGEGLAGGARDEDFFAATTGGLWGFQLGAEVFFVDGWVEHNQHLDGAGLLGTWTQFMLGFDVEFEIGSGDELSKPKTFGMFGVGVGFGVGTPEQVDLPLDNEQVTDKGAVAEVVVGGGYEFNEYIQAILTIPVAYSYMWKNEDVLADENRYHSFHAAVLAGVRFKYTLY